jgi:SAM-dependent methyltransferase
MPANDRIQAGLILLAHAPLRPTDRLLDIGMGAGEITMALGQRVRQVVGTGLRFASYGVQAMALATHSIWPVECLVEALPFAPATFDVVVMSHVLEHTPNVAWALATVRRVLKPGGLLCVLVPPSESVVAGGHISVGWNVGQLMYVLALNGFDVRQGHFAQYGYNVCGLVRRDERPLPPLRHDFGDLRTLANDGRWPLPIDNANSAVEAFRGDLLAVNWPWTDIFQTRRAGVGGRLLRRLLPGLLRVRLGRWLGRLSHALTDDPAQLYAATINPKQLSR